MLHFVWFTLVSLAKVSLTTNSQHLDACRGIVALWYLVSKLVRSFFQKILLGKAERERVGVYTNPIPLESYGVAL